MFKVIAANLEKLNLNFKNNTCVDKRVIQNLINSKDIEPLEVKNKPAPLYAGLKNLDDSSFSPVFNLYKVNNGQPLREFIRYIILNSWEGMAAKISFSDTDTDNHNKYNKRFLRALEYYLDTIQYIAFTEDLEPACFIAGKKVHLNDENTAFYFPGNYSIKKIQKQGLGSFLQTVTLINYIDNVKAQENIDLDKVTVAFRTNTSNLYQSLAKIKKATMVPDLTAAIKKFHKLYNKKILNLYNSAQLASSSSCTSFFSSEKTDDLDSQKAQYLINLLESTGVIKRNFENNEQLLSEVDIDNLKNTYPDFIYLIKSGTGLGSEFNLTKEDNILYNELNYFDSEQQLQNHFKGWVDGLEKIFNQSFSMTKENSEMMYNLAKKDVVISQEEKKAIKENLRSQYESLQSSNKDQKTKPFRDGLSSGTDQYIEDNLPAALNNAVLKHMEKEYSEQYATEFDVWIPTEASVDKKSDNYMLDRYFEALRNSGTGLLCTATYSSYIVKLRAYYPKISGKNWDWFNNKFLGKCGYLDDNDKRLKLYNEKH